MKNYNMKNNKKGLTQYQKEFIIENYSTMKTNDICRILNLQYEKVHSYAQNKKLKKNPYSSLKFNNYFDELLKKRRREEYNVFNYIQNQDEPKTDSLYKSKYGKYFVNQHYFEKIDNEWKAYWLGFLYADGTNRIHKNKQKNKMEYVVKLGLCAEDRNHLQKFKESLQSESPITDRKAKFNNKEYPCCDISICNQQICEDLNKLGCVPNKSLILKFPTEEKVPKSLIRHFIRGYFDGDGCIHINKEEKNVRLLFEGTEDMLVHIRDILYNELNVKFAKIESKQKSKSFHINYGKYSDVELIYKYLYKDCNVFLDRKLKKFDTLYCLD